MFYHVVYTNGCSCTASIVPGGEIIERDGKKFKLFYGMSSSVAMQKYSGKVAEYR